MDTLVKPSNTDTDSNYEGVIHIVCYCDLDVALCGELRESRELLPLAVEATCVVCSDLEKLPCPRCGE